MAFFSHSRRFLLAMVPLAFTACGYVGIELSGAGVRAFEEGVDAAGGADSVASGGQGKVDDPQASGGAVEAGGDMGGSGAVPESGTGGVEPSSSGGNEPSVGGGMTRGSGGDEGVETGGGSGGDAESGGASGTGGDTTVPQCLQGCQEEPEDHLFFHSFEDDIPEGIWQEGAASYELSDDLDAPEGGNSMKLTTQSAGAQIEVNNQFEQKDEGEILFRAWLFIPDDSMRDWIKVIGFNSNTGSGVGIGASGIHIRLATEGRFHVLGARSDELWESERQLFPEGEWFCLQVHVSISDDEGKIDVRVNGRSVFEVVKVNTRPGGGIQRIVYGIAEVGSENAESVLYFNQVTASLGAVPCED